MSDSTPSRKYDKPLQVRVSEDLYELYEKAAEKSGLSLSGWARDRLARLARQELEQAPTQGGRKRRSAKKSRPPRAGSR